MLNPLLWMFGTSLAGTGVLVTAQAPTALLVVMGIIDAALFLMFAVFFVMFALKNPDALRSESYTLSKMAMEKGLFGDHAAGVRRVEDAPEVTAPVALPLKEGSQ